MTILSILKKKKKTETKPVEKTFIQKLNIEQARTRHRNRISNLTNEYHKINGELEIIELSDEITKTVKSKESDGIIRRMTLINYEIAIREEVLRWL